MCSSTGARSYIKITSVGLTKSVPSTYMFIHSYVAKSVPSTYMFPFPTSFFFIKTTKTLWTCQDFLLTLAEGKTAHNYCCDRCGKCLWTTSQNEHVWSPPLPFDADVSSLLLFLFWRFVPIPLLENIVTTMAAVKMNVLHLHASDFCRFSVESKIYPNLTKGQTTINAGRCSDAYWL